MGQAAQYDYAMNANDMDQPYMIYNGPPPRRPTVDVAEVDDPPESEEDTYEFGELVTDRWWWLRPVLTIAAILVIGIAIGFFLSPILRPHARSAPALVDTTPAPNPIAPAPAPLLQQQPAILPPTPLDAAPPAATIDAEAPSLKAAAPPPIRVGHHVRPKAHGPTRTAMSESAPKTKLPPIWPDSPPTGNPGATGAPGAEPEAPH